MLLTILKKFNWDGAVKYILLALILLIAGAWFEFYQAMRHGSWTHVMRGLYMDLEPNVTQESLKHTIDTDSQYRLLRGGHVHTGVLSSGYPIIIIELDKPEEQYLVVYRDGKSIVTIAP